jgi:hypothetical protein
MCSTSVADKVPGGDAVEEVAVPAVEPAAAAAAVGVAAERDEDATDVTEASKATSRQ